MRPQRIALHVAHDSQQVMIFLDWEGLEAHLPDPSGRRVLLVIPAYVSGEQPMHPIREIFCARGPHYKMNVVGHQAYGEQRYNQTLLSSRDEREELLVVRLL